MEGALPSSVKPEQIARKTESQRRAQLSQACKDFTNHKDRNNVNLLVLGSQHHGKSSFVNHLFRCIQNNADLLDQLDTAPAGKRENTFHVKTIKIPLTDKLTLHARDTPAIKSLSGENEKLLEGIVAHWVPEGSRREDFLNESWEKPADCAIICVSLPHWLSEKGDTKEWLETCAKKLKEASGGEVPFPYAIAITKVDECFEEHGTGQNLERIKREVAGAANTNSVFALCNRKEGEPWSEENAAETIHLLSSLLSIAKRVDTGSVKERERQVRFFVAVVSIVVVILAAFFLFFKRKP